MATVPRTTTPIQHYAYLGATYGTAELLNGSGWLFRKDGERTAILVSYTDPEMVLLGRCDVADFQHDIDVALGGAPRIACDRQMEVA